VLAFDSRLPLHNGYQHYIDWAFQQGDSRLIEILIRSNSRIYWNDVVDQAIERALPILRIRGSRAPYHEQERLLGVCPSCPRITFGYKGLYACNEGRILECEKCGRVDRFCDGTQHKVPDHPGTCDICEEDAPTESLRLMDAYRAARQARF